MNKGFYLICQSPGNDKIWNQNPFIGTRKALHDSWRKGHLSVYREFCIDHPGSIVTVNGLKVNWKVK